MSCVPTTTVSVDYTRMVQRSVIRWPLLLLLGTLLRRVRLPDTASIFRAELYAISFAIDFIRHSKDTRFIVFSDSESSLEALNSFRTELELVLKITKDYTSLIRAGKVIEFCWIPSHVNIPGNERANAAAKALPAFCQHEITSI